MSSIFINCPYDIEYRPTLYRLMFSALEFSLNPVVALDDSGSKLRLQKIQGMISKCEYSFHDMSLIDVPRFNMPFEAGMGFYRHLTDEINHSVLLAVRNQSEFDENFSDLRGIDPAIYSSEDELITLFATWLSECHSDDQISPSVSSVIERSKDCIEKLPRIANAKNYSFDKIPMPETKFMLRAYMVKFKNPSLHLGDFW